MKRISTIHLLLLVMVTLGCTPTEQSTQQPRQTVKPIDRVREGIAAVSTDLDQTIVSAQLLSNNSSGSHSSFSAQLQTTERDVAALRADAAELRDRAADYLLVWSGQTYTITGDSHAQATDPGRDSAKTKYDQLVASMISAKQIVLPLLERLNAIKANEDPAATRSDVERAASDATRARAHLNEALARIDELKNLLQASGQ